MLRIQLISGTVPAIPNSLIMHQLTKIQKINLISILPCKMSWDFSKKEECNKGSNAHQANEIRD